MHWVLQENIFNEQAYERLIDALNKFDIEYSIHKVVPFVGELIPSPEDELNSGNWSTEHNVICFGSYSMRHAADKYEWEPGVFDLEPEDFTVQKAHWGNHMLNHDSTVVRFEDAHFDAPLMFVRPIHDSKVFAGRVFEREEFEKWKHSVVELKEDDGSTMTANTLIQLSQPKNIYAEYRFWVVQGDIITASLYKRGSKVMYQEITNSSEPLLFEYVEARIAEWQPHEAFCIDIADTHNGLKIVEINTLNSSGLYAADIDKLVMALENAFDCVYAAPLVGSVKYKKVLKAGCAGRTDYWGEFYCGHNYQWSCDECPIVLEKYKDEVDEPAKVIQLILPENKDQA